MESLPTEIVQHILSCVPLSTVASLLHATKLTRTSALAMLDNMDRVDAKVNEIPLEARVAVVLHCTSLITINGLVVKSVELEQNKFAKGFSVSMVLHLVRRNPKLQHFVLYDSIPCASYSDILLSTLKRCCPSLKSFYSEAEHPDVALIKEFLRGVTLEEVSFPNSQLHALLSGGCEGNNSNEQQEEISWSFGPSVYGLFHRSDSRRKVHMWRKASVVASRGSSEDLEYLAAISSSFQPSAEMHPPNFSPLRSSSMSLRGSCTISCSSSSSSDSSASTPVSLRFMDSGRHSPLAQSSGPRSLSALSVSSDFISRVHHNSHNEAKDLFISRSTGVLRESITSA